MGDDEGQDELVTEEMLWDRIPEVHGEERANTYYELSARIFARGQYDEALALAETARDIFSELGAAAPSEGLAQAYSAIGYNLNQLKRMDEAATAMSKAVAILRENKSPIALELACTLGEWWYSSKNYEKSHRNNVRVLPRTFSRWKHNWCGKRYAPHWLRTSRT